MPKPAQKQKNKMDVANDWTNRCSGNMHESMDLLRYRRVSGLLDNFSIQQKERLFERHFK